MKKLKKLLKHLFLPHRGNAYRPHAVRHKMLSLYSLGLFFSQILLGVTFYSGPVIMNADAKVIAKNVITQSNFERKNNSLSAFYENETLNQAAAKKLEDMFEKNYWDHKGPNGETAWEFIDGTGYQYLLAGENLARGFASSEEAVRAWMNSPTHRANILNSRFQEMGVAVGSGKINGAQTTVIVQLFGQPKTVFAGVTKKEILGAERLIPEVSLKNATQPSKIPYLITWTIIFGLIILDGAMVRKLGLHTSKSHVFNLRASLLIAAFTLIILTTGFAAIA